jgi:hypothetical protein
MEEFIARENIRRFEAQLAVCTDERQKAVLQSLLNGERQRLEQWKQRAVAAEQSKLSNSGD